MDGLNEIKQAGTLLETVRYGQLAIRSVLNNSNNNYIKKQGQKYNKDILELIKKIALTM